MAGSARIIELHGNIWHVRCTKCSRVSENRDVPISILPYCDNCGGLLRPHVVWFGENLEEDIIEAAIFAVRRCDLLMQG